MLRAIALGRQGAFEERAGGPFGAVIVKDGRIVGEGFNRVILKGDPTCHGEMEAIRDAAKNLGTHVLEGCTLYTSAECCPMCAAAAWWARIDRIFYAATIDDAETFGSFDDTAIYEDLRKPPGERKIPSCNVCRDDALAVWREFETSPLRVHY